MSCPVFSDAESCFVGVEFVGVQLHLGPCSGGWFVCGFGVRCVLLPAFGGDEPFRVGVGAFHVDDPFAAPSGVFCRSGRGGVELTFEVGIDAAFEPVGVVGRSVLLEVGEEHAVALHRDDAEVGAAQPFMGPPPCAPRLGLGVVGIGPGVRAFLDVAVYVQCFLSSLGGIFPQLGLLVFRSVAYRN